MTSIKNLNDLIISELYKTNLKFRILNNSVIEIINHSMQPIAAIFPLLQIHNQNHTDDTPSPQHSLPLP